MSYRAFVIPTAIFLAVALGGCRSNSNKDYDEVLMPLQTGSTIQRRVLVPSNPDKKSKKKTEKSEKTEKKEKKEKSRKPDAEPSATPAPEEESTPPPERFR